MVKCTNCVMKKKEGHVVEYHDKEQKNTTTVATCPKCKTEYSITSHGIVTVKEVEE